MDYTKPIELGIATKLKRDENYCKAFFRAYVTDSIALQIRGLRKLRDNMKQADLAQACGMKQSAISRIEQAEYSAWTFNTLCRVADALEARLIVQFQPIEEAIKDYEVQEASAVPVTDSAGNVYVSSRVVLGDRSNLTISNELPSPGRIEHFSMNLGIKAIKQSMEISAHD